MLTRVRLYVGFVTLLGLVGLINGWMYDPLVPAELPAVLVLGALVALSASTMERAGSEGVALSFNTVAFMAAIPIAGPIGAGLIAAVAPLFDHRNRWRLPHLFNTAMFAVVVSAAGLVYIWSGGVHPVPASGSPTTIARTLGLPLLAANVAGAVVNILLLAGIMAVSQGRLRVVLGGVIRQTIPLYGGYALLSFLLVVLWVPSGAGPLSALLILAPLFVAQWTYRQYGDERRARAAIVTALLTAAGQSDVPRSRAAVAMVRVLSRVLGLGAHTVADLDLAAQIHDLGRARIPIPSAQPQPDPLAELAGKVAPAHPHDDDGTHVTTAEAVLGSLDFAAGALPVLRHHHEHYDGTGWPDGLAGDEIPVGARVMALAAGVVAATDGTGRTDLLTLQALSGRLYDPELVAVLPRCLDDPEWKAAVARFLIAPDVRAEDAQGEDGGRETDPLDGGPRETDRLEVDARQSDPRERPAQIEADGRRVAERAGGS